MLSTAHQQLSDSSIRPVDTAKGAAGVVKEQRPNKRSGIDVLPHAHTSKDGYLGFFFPFNFLFLSRNCTLKKFSYKNLCQKSSN